ncbi:serine protease [Halieaceae bacterium IMCC14734]|uniref:Serine protease n=1 Tax=Candidatus Litorirhabdus singularis TaxID=2518993 RepID=A0ABT3TD75_9GAMM|nr:patatin-like phospholipase family protein [Candidatus Litorirhabdus singularis]MCX2980223.1 serine protease [Candidatus Litorirhabdus singularis]
MEESDTELPAAAGKKKTTLSLVLGSGGARGMAHIGVIRELERAGFEIASIAGCSMGAVVGGVYAAGKLDDFERWVTALTSRDMLRMLDLSWNGSGLVKGDRIIAALTELVGQRNIEDLPIPYTAVAADVKNEKEVWLNKGSLFDAIRASMSLPLFFTPVEYKYGHLLDGGILNPVPIAPTFNDSTDFTVAVNLGGPKIAELHEPVLAQEPAEESSALRETLDKFIDTLSATFSDKEVGPVTSGFLAVADEAFDAMQSSIARQKLASYPPDVLIEIARNRCGTWEFDRAQEMIELGQSKTRECLSRVDVLGSVSGGVHGLG